MKTLMKYEFRKTLLTKLIILGSTAAMELFFLISLALRDEHLSSTAAVGLVLLTIGGISFIGLQSVLTLHQDMNTKRGYMLFMTPNSCYKILGAKVLENGLSILLAGACFFALGMLDIGLLFVRYGRLNEIWDFVQWIIRTLSQEVEINAQYLAVLMFNMLAAWIATVTCAYLADVISSALLNGKKHNLLVSFLLFLLLSFGITWVGQKFVVPGQSILSVALVRGAVFLCFAALMYVAAAQIMEKKLSV